MRFEKKSLDGLGVEVSGGYRVGIYVIELQENSICKAVGLQVGDRLLKVKNEIFFCIVFLSLFYIWCFYKQIIKNEKVYLMSVCCLWGSIYFNVLNDGEA